MSDTDAATTGDEEPLKKAQNAGSSPVIRTSYSAAMPVSSPAEKSVRKQIGRHIGCNPYNPMKRMLIIDGGGMRGYIPAAVLVELERLSGKPCCEMFDLIAGTSIGGILAALLAVGTPASDTINFFTQDGPKIFKKTWHGWWRWNGILAPRYPARPIESALQARFGGRFLSDCKTRLLVASLDLVTQDPFFFENFSGYCANYALWEVGRGTSAAQTYFPAFKLGNKILWDGGNVANNPAVCAMADAANLWGLHHLPDKVLSLGCGNQLVKLSPHKMVNAGFLRNAAATVGMLFEAGPEDADFQMKQIFGGNYVRIQPDTGDLALDDASPEGLQKLQMAAQQNAASSLGTLQKFLAESNL
jgi:uncharacterized protein